MDRLKLVTAFATRSPIELGRGPVILNTLMHEDGSGFKFITGDVTAAATSSAPVHGSTNGVRVIREPDGIGNEV